ncbi:hypothetical protein QZH41_008744, partial [Actinostola sp. cb2023]
NIPAAMAAIQAAIREWEMNSCLKFVRRTTENDYLDIFKGSGPGEGSPLTPWRVPYLDIFKGSGCWSYVGRQGGRQQLSLADGCWHLGTIAHEIGHAMGFWHEQSRPDRDQFVTIVWDNIPESKTTRPLTSPVPNPPPPGPDTCDFDTMGDTCGFHNVIGDDFEWTQRLGKTPSGNTGPAADHTTGRWGWFMYIETSSPRVQDEQAILRSKAYLAAPGERCLHFYYHMLGKHMGQLSIKHSLVKPSSVENTLWSMSGSQAKPVIKNRVILTDIRHMIKNKDLLPPDHLEGSKLERDGDLNKDFHHEAFLGKLIKDGKLVFENMNGYKKLIEIFHKVDYSKDHLVDREELGRWIHERILEHVESAREKNQGLFKSVDKDGDGLVSWTEFRRKLLQGEGNDTVNDEALLKQGEDGGLPDEFAKWKKADLNFDKKLDVTEFLYFQHPEYNPNTIKNMAADMMVNFDKNNDKAMSVDEFVSLPPGEVDPDQVEAEKKYAEDRKEEFKRMDKNGDGIVKLEELATYLDPRHQQHAANEASYLINVADSNKDDKLSEKEMLFNYQLFTGSSLNNYAGVLHDEF